MRTVLAAVTIRSSEFGTGSETASRIRTLNLQRTNFDSSRTYLEESDGLRVQMRRVSREYWPVFKHHFL